MYWAALSTDIKKSSVNWSGLPNWMQNAVQYHNIIIETVVSVSNDRHNNFGKTVTCELLPNAPEGDAFTYVFHHNNMDELKEFVILLGTDLQYVLDKLREPYSVKKVLRGNGSNRNDNEELNDKEPEKHKKLQRKIMLRGDDLIEELKKQNGEVKEKFETYKLFQKKEYFGGIFIRVGVAFSEEAPIPYTFKRYRGANNSSSKISKSYRSGVICLAEKAEEKADYKPISRLEGDDVKVSPVIKECYLENGERKFRDLFEKDGNELQKSNVKKGRNQKGRNRRRGSIKSSGLNVDLTNVPKSRQEDVLGAVKEALKGDLDPEKVQKVNGFCVFVEYERALKDKRVMESPHLKTLIEQEYIDIHVKANQVVKNFIDGKEGKGFRGGLVKQKRDSTSMFVILQNKETMEIKSLIDPSTKLYQKFSKLVSSLPIGSCIGFAYGTMKEITMKRGEEGTFTDYFEDCVNLAARMAMRDWSYTTKWGMVGENEHHNRVAFTSKKKETNRNLIRTVATRLEVDKVPFTYDHVPLSALNAGDDTTIECISTKFVGWERFRIGDIVKMNTGNRKKHEIEGDFGDYFKLDGIKELKAREELTKVREKTFNDEEFKNFKIKLKL